MREYEAAIDAAKQSLRTFPDHPLVYPCLAAALGQVGRLDEARDALQQAIALSPKSFDPRQRGPWVRPEDHEHGLEGLRKAGWNG
jgi:adenylate cyclase